LHSLAGVAAAFKLRYFLTTEVTKCTKGLYPQIFAIAGILCVCERKKLESGNPELRNFPEKGFLISYVPDSK